MTSSKRDSDAHSAFLAAQRKARDEREKRAVIYMSRADGCHVHEIARAQGISTERVAAILAADRAERDGVAERGARERQTAAERVRRAVELRRSGATIREIAEELEIELETVRQLLRAGTKAERIERSAENEGT